MNPKKTFIWVSKKTRQKLRDSFSHERETYDSKIVSLLDSTKKSDQITKILNDLILDKKLCNYLRVAIKKRGLEKEFLNF